MTNNNNYPELLKKLYPLEEDLIFFYGELRVYSRNEIFRMIANKFQVLKNPQLIGIYLESIIRYQGEKYSLISKENPAESLILFFDDIRKAVQKISPDILQRTDFWLVDLSEAFFALKNSAYFFAHGKYLEEDENFPSSDMMVKYCIDILSGNDGQKKIPSDDKLIGITEAAKKLSCSRTQVYKVHFKKGLKSVFPNGPDGHQKISLLELYRYMDEMKQQQK